MAISTAFDPSDRARGVGIKTTFKDLRQGNILLLPQRIAMFGQGRDDAEGDYTLDRKQVTSAVEVGETYGFGSPLHLMAEQLFPVNGDGVGSIPVTVYPMKKAAGAIAATATMTVAAITATVQETFIIRISGINSAEFKVLVGDDQDAIAAKVDVAINAIFNMPVSSGVAANVVTLTSVWNSAQANNLAIEIFGPDDTLIDFAPTAFASGAGEPLAELNTALALMADTWETLVLNGLNQTANIFNAYQTFGDGRWGPLVKKPLMVFHGENEVDETALVAIADTRKTDRVNAYLVAPGSPNLRFVIAARELAKLATVANIDPPRDYGSQAITGIIAGIDQDQWTYAERDLAIKGGVSSIRVKDGVINLSDTVTFFHPDGDQNPAYRYVCDVVKVQNIVYKTNLIFDNAEWDGAPLVPNDQPISSPSAKKPRMAVAEVAAMIDNLALAAIISDPETAKSTILAEIDSENPKRLNVTFTVQLSGNANIISIDFNFGFYFGVQQLVA